MIGLAYEKKTYHPVVAGGGVVSPGSAGGIWHRTAKGAGGFRPGLFMVFMVYNWHYVNYV